MDELIGRLVANVGVDRTAARTAVGIILPLRCRGEDVRSTTSPQRPRAQRARGGGDIANEFEFRRHVRHHGGGIEHAARCQAVAREAIGYARQMVGENAVGEIVGAIPGSASSSDARQRSCQGARRIRCRTPSPTSGLDADEAKKLRARRIRTTERLLEAARTPKGRQGTRRGHRHRREAAAVPRQLRRSHADQGHGQGVCRILPRGRRRHRAGAEIPQSGEPRQCHGRAEQASASWSASCRP